MSPQRRKTLLPRRRGAIAVTTALGVAFSIAGAGAWAASANPSPVDALQSVDLTLASDGTVTAMKRTDVISQENGDIEREEGDLKPSDAAALPVVVSTSWVHDGKTGTDFSDLKGKSGRIELSVTITNTTTRVEPFTVDAGERSVDTYGLVSVPVTVVGAVDLGDLDGSEVVRSASGKGEPGTTNGAVSTGDKTLVQWAAVLAPPRLAPNATFRVVVDADDFDVPDFHLSAQPGLVSDPSVETLFAQAFGSRSPIAQVQQTTADLTDSLSQQLVATSSLLTQIRGTLDTNAESAGPAATADLQSAAAAAVGQLETIIGDLSSINTQASSAITSARTTGTTTLATALTSMKSFIGVPKDWTAADEEADAASSGCKAIAPVDPKGSLYEQLHAIRAAMHTVSAASAACVGIAEANLDAVLGTLEHKDAAGNVTQAATDCEALKDEPVDAQPLICRFDATQRKLDGVQAALVAVASTRNLSLDSSRSTLQSKLNDLIADVVETQEETSKLGGGAIADVVDALGTVQTTLDSLNTKKVALVSALGDVLPNAADGVDALQAQVDALRSKVCAAPTLDETVLAGDTDGVVKKSVDDYRAELRDLVDTAASAGSCSDLPAPQLAAADDLASDVDADAASWEKVQDAYDAATGGGSSLTSLINNLSTKVEDLLDSFDSAGGGDVSAQLAGVQSLACELFQGSSILVDGDDQSSSKDNYSGCDDTTAGPLDKLTLAIEQLNTTTKKKLNTDWSDEVAAQFDPVAAIVTTAKQDVDAVNTQTDTKLGAMLADLQSTITESANRLVTSAATNLHTSLYGANGFETTIASNIATINGEMTAAITTLGNSITSSQGDLAKTRASLDASIKAALGQLSGVIGLMGAQSDQVGTGQDQIGDVQNEARGFGSVRRGDQLDQLLASQQLDKGLQLVPSLTWFGDDLPDGSKHSTLITFVVKDDK